MPDLADGESVEMRGSARLPYILKNTGGVYSCTCPAWRNQSVAIEQRTCKHLRKYRGEEAERERLGTALEAAPQKPTDEEEGAAGPPLLLAQTWANDVDLSGWWMSEKLDGVRAYWDGQQFLSRLGNVFHAPEWFLAGLPETPLDGELWLARKAFQRTVSIVRRQDKSDHWRQMRFLVFDAPALNEPFEQRIEYLRDCLLANSPEFAAAHEQHRCESLDHLRAELTRIEALGGEGLMLREPGSRYEAGRSSSLLKVKTFHDAEARVVGHLPGTGRHKGRLGALAVELPNGTSFSVGTGFSDAQRNTPPPVGSTITFRYQELSERGVPRFPSFVRVRLDAGTGVLNASPAEPAKAPLPTASSPRSNSQTSGAIAAGSAPQGATSRRFEFVEGKSSKFWEISIDGNDVTVQFGRIGTQGQSKTKTFGDSEAAARHAEGLIAEKTEKGYVETSG